MVLSRTVTTLVSIQCSRSGMAKTADKKWHSVDDDNSGNPFGIRYANNTSDSRADRENLP